MLIPLLNDFNPDDSGAEEESNGHSDAQSEGEDSGYGDSGLSVDPDDYRELATQTDTQPDISVCIFSILGTRIDSHQ